jgi:hypothetical protein
MHFSAAAASTPFGRAARAHIHVDPGHLGFGAMHHAGHVAIGDQPDRGAGRTDLAIMSSCRGRSSTQTVMSSVETPLAAAKAETRSDGVIVHGHHALGR